MAVWLAHTGHGTNAGKSNSWRMGNQPAQPVTVPRAPIPPARELKELGVGINLDAKHGTSPVLQGRFERGEAILQRVGCLPTLGTAMYSVELTAVGEKDLACLKQKAVRALWGPTHVSQAREVLWAVPVPLVWVPGARA